MLAFRQDVPGGFDISRLSPLLRARYLRGRLSQTQAQAFSVFNNPQAQDALFKQLGLLACKPEILEAIRRGDTVLPIEDDFLILPSRTQKPARKTAALNPH